MNIMQKLFHLVAIAAVAGVLLVAPSAAHAGTVITVNTTEGTINTNGNCSLPEAVQAANTDASADGCPAGSGTDTIQFNIPGSSPYIIYPSGVIDVVTPIIIDGTSQPGYTGTPVIVVDGNKTLGGGFDFYDASAGSVMKGLRVADFTYVQVRIESGDATSHVTLTGNYIGTDGLAGLGGTFGVELPSAKYAVIGGPNGADRNVISGNYVNVLISDSGDYNTVQGNYIGLNAAGTASVAGSGYGVRLVTDPPGASNNTIKGNVISGNTTYGVYIPAAGSDNNIIESNYIGTNAAGTAAVSPAAVSGIAVAGGANNVIGGTLPGMGNLVSGTDYGISVYGPASGTKIFGNRIGTDKNGMAAIPNSQAGIRIQGAAVDVGDATTPGNNLISGNSASPGRGLEVDGATSGTTIMGNKIGFNLSGGALPNIMGIGLWSGGSARIAQNWIADNVNWSIYIDPTSNAASGDSLNSGNCFMTNGAMGLSSENPTPADFRSNWWGAVDGPGGAGSGGGDKVWGVTYIPFLTTAPVACQGPLTISGNAGIAGATLSYTDVTPKTATSDAGGDYILTVSYNWSGAVTPSKTGYTFMAASRTYSNLAADQSNQNYTAMAGGAPVVGRTYPFDGGEDCLRPQIGLEMWLTDLVRSGGSFDPSKIMLKLDGLDVTGSAKFAQTETYPASIALILFIPPSELAVGEHEAILSYPVAGGTLFRHWNFTASSAASCGGGGGGGHSPTLDSAPVPDSAPPSVSTEVPDPLPLGIQAP